MAYRLGIATTPIPSLIRLAQKVKRRRKGKEEKERKKNLD